MKIEQIGLNGFPITKEQKAIIEHINDPNKGCLKVQAYAGCSKTTTIMEAIRYLPESKPTLLTCFNKEIADELKKKAPKWVKASTLNSIGHGAIFSFVKYRGNEKKENEMQLSYSKIGDIYDEMTKDDENPDWHKKKTVIRKAVDVARNNGLIPTIHSRHEKSLVEDDRDTWYEMLEKSNIISEARIKISKNYENAEDKYSKMEIEKMIEKDLEKYVDVVIDASRKILKVSLKMTSVIDFTDQLYMPFVYPELILKKYDYVFVDEAQDLNPVQHELIKTLWSGRGKVVIVGDRRQAIYQWRGAVDNSLDVLGAHFKSSELVLPYSFRCPVNVIKMAQQYVPQIKPFKKDAGVVEDRGFYNPAHFKKGDMVLCRYNAPLLEIAYDLLEMKKPFIIRGKDFIGQLITMITSFEVDTVEQLVEALDKWKETEISAMLKRNPDANLSSVEDKYESIMTFVDRCGMKYVGQIVNFLKELKNRSKIGTKTNSVVLSTIHQAKGQEADRVYFVNYASIPSRFAKTPEELKAEDNVAYVGVTRAKQELIFVVTKEDYLTNKILDQLEMNNGAFTLSEKDMEMMRESNRGFGQGKRINQFVNSCDQHKRGAIDPRDYTDDEAEIELMTRTRQMVEVGQVVSSDDPFFHEKLDIMMKQTRDKHHPDGLPINDYDDYDDFLPEGDERMGDFIDY